MSLNITPISRLAEERERAYLRASSDIARRAERLTDLADEFNPSNALAAARDIESAAARDQLRLDAWRETPIVTNIGLGNAEIGPGMARSPEEAQRQAATLRKTSLTGTPAPQARRDIDAEDRRAARLAYEAAVDKMNRDNAAWQANAQARLSLARVGMLPAQAKVVGDALGKIAAADRRGAPLTAEDVQIIRDAAIPVPRTVDQKRTVAQIQLAVSKIESDISRFSKEAQAAAGKARNRAEYYAALDAIPLDKYPLGGAYAKKLAEASIPEHIQKVDLDAEIIKQREDAELIRGFTAFAAAQGVSQEDITEMVDSYRTTGAPGMLMGSYISAQQDATRRAGAMGKEQRESNAKASAAIRFNPDNPDHMSIAAPMLTQQEVAAMAWKPLAVSGTAIGRAPRIDAATIDSVARDATSIGMEDALNKAMADMPGLEGNEAFKASVRNDIGRRAQVLLKTSVSTRVQRAFAEEINLEADRFNTAASSMSEFTQDAARGLAAQGASMPQALLDTAKRLLNINDDDSSPGAVAANNLVTRMASGEAPTREEVEMFPEVVSGMRKLGATFQGAYVEHNTAAELNAQKKRDEMIGSLLASGSPLEEDVIATAMQYGLENASDSPQASAMMRDLRAAGATELDQLPRVGMVVLDANNKLADLGYFSPRPPIRLRDLDRDKEFSRAAMRIPQYMPSAAGDNQSTPNPMWYAMQEDEDAFAQSVGADATGRQTLAYIDGLLLAPVEVEVDGNKVTRLPTADDVAKGTFGAVATTQIRGGKLKESKDTVSRITKLALREAANTEMGRLLLDDPAGRKTFGRYAIARLVEKMDLAAMAGEQEAQAYLSDYSDDPEGLERMVAALEQRGDDATAEAGAMKDAVHAALVAARTQALPAIQGYKAVGATGRAALLEKRLAALESLNERLGKLAKEEDDAWDASRTSDEYTNRLFPGFFPGVPY